MIDIDVRFKVSNHAVDRYLERVGAANRRAAHVALAHALIHSEELTGADWRRTVKPQDMTDQTTDHRIYRPLELVLVLSLKGRVAVVMTVFRLRPFNGRTLKGTRRHVGKQWRESNKARARRRELELLRIRELERDGRENC